MSDPGILLVAVVSVVMALLVLRSTRHHRGGSIPVLVGLTLSVSGVAAGLLLLPIHDAPSGSLKAIGFVPPAKARPGRGFAIGVAVRVEGCSNPVSVSVVAAGTRDYWTDHKNGPLWSPFSLVLPGTDLRDLRVGLANAATDLTTPADTTLSSRYARLVKIDPPRRSGGLTVVSGRVAYWQQTLQPLAATFRAPWLVRRGLSSCYLKLPPLSGALTVLSAEAALGPEGLRQYGLHIRGNVAVVHAEGVTGPYDPALEITHGTTTVTEARGEVLPDASLPAPTELVGGDPAWTCRSLAANTGSIERTRKGRLPAIVLGRTGAGFSEAVIEGAASGDCRGVAAIGQDSETYSRDLVLLGVGALTSLGITLIVQGLIDWLAGTKPDSSPQASRAREPAKRRKRRPRWHARDLQDQGATDARGDPGGNTDAAE